MSPTLVLFFLAVVASIGLFFVFDNAYPAGSPYRDLGIFLTGLVPSALLQFVSSLSTPEPLEPAPSTARPDGELLGYRAVILVMVLCQLLFAAAAQTIAWALQDEMMRMGTGEVSKKAVTALSVIVAGAQTYHVYFALGIVAFLLGLAGVRIRYWYFLAGSFVSALLLFLPKLLRLDPTSLSFLDVLAEFTGLDPRLVGAGDRFADPTMLTIRTGALAVVAFGLPVLWYLAARLGRRCRGWSLQPTGP